MITLARIVLINSSAAYNYCNVISLEKNVRHIRKSIFHCRSVINTIPKYDTCYVVSDNINKEKNHIYGHNEFDIYVTNNINCIVLKPFNYTGVIGKLICSR